MDCDPPPPQPMFSSFEWCESDRKTISLSSLRTAGLRGDSGMVIFVLPFPSLALSYFFGYDDPEGRLRWERWVPRGKTHGVHRRGNRLIRRKEKASKTIGVG